MLGLFSGAAGPEAKCMQMRKTFKSISLSAEVLVIDWVKLERERETAAKHSHPMILESYVPIYYGVNSHAAIFEQLWTASCDSVAQIPDGSCSALPRQGRTRPR